MATIYNYMMTNNRARNTIFSVASPTMEFDKLWEFVPLERKVRRLFAHEHKRVSFEHFFVPSINVRYEHKRVSFEHKA